ncbi:hypothetical protein I6N90_12465 [Paenibacillus sp. GSMTC-2017]|uniref:hypothetical protein n=1 Tax=Paenibacillus sp. GSMTC-2017 TaxID=2794350 RepID=UPI0018D612FE|nr:hypothetical protein [Paenibacillus sp. GSMTC-2017]MBH5318610.1 hypothetical protein [Paenibacillus sp. GSMTC-2017]
MKIMKVFITIILFMLLYPSASTIANAGVIERIKGIYDAPEELQKLQDQYDETTSLLQSQLESQREQLELAKQQNEKLLADNQKLMEKMEKMEENRQSLFSKIAYAVGTLIALVAVYAISVRIWRYIVWRKQGRDQQSAMLP